MKNDSIKKYLIPNIPYLFILWAFAEAKAQARTEKPHPKRKEPDRERS